MPTMYGGGERLGVFGGTFDPPHRVHLAVAYAALEQCELDRVLFVVAGRPWQKEGIRPISPAEDRLRMTELLVAEEPRFEVSRTEVGRSGASYTVDTLEELAVPGRALVLILGADAAEGLPTWRRWERIRNLAEVAVVERPGGRWDRTCAALRGVPLVRVEMDPVDVSSTDLRAALGRGARADDVPGRVRAYIREKDLYGRS